MRYQHLLLILVFMTFVGCSPTPISTPRVGPTASSLNKLNQPATNTTGTINNPVAVSDDGMSLMEWPNLPPEDIAVSPSPTLASPSPSSSSLPALERISNVRFLKSIKSTGVEIRPVWLDSSQKWVSETFNGDVNVSYTILESNLNWEIVVGTAVVNSSRPGFISEGTTDVLHDNLKTGKVDITAQLNLPNNRTINVKRQPFMSDSEFQTLQQQAQTANITPNMANQTSTSALKLLFKAALIRKNGEITAIPRTEFIIRPYNQRKIRANLLLKNNPPVKPVDPTVRNGDLKPCNNPALDEPACADYRLLRQTYREQLLPEWERLAYQGEDAEIARLALTRSNVSVKTDLNGEAQIQLAPGVWYVSGYYQLLDGRHSLTWDSTPIEIKADSQRLEVSNENARVLNNRP